MVMRYGFDDGFDSLARIADDTGRGHTLRLRPTGARVREVEREGGLAVQFPGRCGTRGDCSQAMLETPDADDLKPGSRPFQYGAIVKLRRSQTTAGSNVMQKGYAHRGNQWKLQVDGRLGRPSCVLAGSRYRIYKALASVSVADGAWHAVECRRRDSSLEVLVDGRLRGQVSVPAELSIDNSAPVRIGSNGLAMRNDQFHGAVDEVFLQVG